MSDVSYAGPLNQWLAQAAPQPPPRVMGKSLAELLGPYLGNAKPGDTQPNASGKVPSPDFTVPPPGLRPRESDAFVPNLGAAKSIAAGAVEPFGQLGRVMTGQSQDVPTDLLGAAAGLAPIGPPGKGAALKAGAEAAEGALKKGATGTLSDFITAYHGSPHDFDRFDLSKIGTGEGAQAYGHGLYFAENPKVAEDYKKTLAYQSNLSGADRFDAEALKYIHQHGGVEQAKSAIDAEMKQWANNPATVAHLTELKKAVREPNPGRMYQVAIKSNPEHFLDWDKPLNEQSPKVREAMAPILKEHGLHEENPDYLAGTHILNRMSEKLSHEPGSSASPAVTQRLREAGIPGIKYLDQGSRVPAMQNAGYMPRWQAAVDKAQQDFASAQKSGASARTLKELQAEVDRTNQGLATAKQHEKSATRNYVVFDDKLIDILKKYGIAGIGALPAMNAYHYQDKGN